MRKTPSTIEARAFELRSSLLGKWSWSDAKYASNESRIDDQTIGLYKTPDLAAYKGGRVFVAWSYLPEGALVRSLYLGESNDFGGTWKTPIMVSQENHMAEDPSLEVDGSGALYLAWEDRPRTKCCTDIVFSQRGASTDTSPPPEPVAEIVPPGGQHYDLQRSPGECHAHFPPRGG